jgi:hypothetical protein
MDEGINMEKCTKGTHGCKCDDCLKARRGKIEWKMVISIVLISYGIAIMVNALELHSLLVFVFGGAIVGMFAFMFVHDLIYLIKNTDMISRAEV